ncbi:MAG: hypothetical protein IPG99_15155 [Ignavibacteria bacterium]|nr:hypothetical protein [Ignavibacteria bacterium]
MWDNATIPYTIHKNLQQDIIERIENAIEHYHKHTFFRLQKRQGESHYLRFKPSKKDKNYTSDGCGGYDSKAVTIWLTEGASFSTIVHEIGHAIGLDHEQQRSDRDKYVEVIEENISPGMKGNFKIPKRSITFGEYDYRSFMHYGAYTKAKPWHYQWRKKPNILRTVIIDSEWFVFALNSSTGSVEIRKMKYSGNKWIIGRGSL